MTITTARRAYVRTLFILFGSLFSVASFAQSTPLRANTSAFAVAPDLSSTLTELMRVAGTTNQDLSQFHQSRLHWLTFWRRDSAHRAQMAAALRRNLRFAVPNLIHETQVSGGSVSTTFNLYRDLSLVCESVNSLLYPASHNGKSDMRGLTNDLADMNRIREDLSLYIVQTATALENKNPQFVLSAGRLPRKIIIDDTVPEKPRSRKQRTARQ